jgi:uracil-DNA glycosylase
VLPSDLVNVVSHLRFPNTFNPYSDECPVHDRSGAASLRRTALLAMLNAAVKVNVDSLWIGRDLGYRGGRRTGLPLTDDVHLPAYARRWGITFQRPTKGPAVAERTAATIWGHLSSIRLHVVLWNVFPLHPHEANQPFSNRAHNADERTAGEDVLAAMIKLLRPTRLVAIGNDASAAVARLAGPNSLVAIRHPSYGGQRQFAQQVQALYGTVRSSVQLDLISKATRRADDGDCSP